METLRHTYDFIISVKSPYELYTKNHFTLDKKNLSLLTRHFEIVDATGRSVGWDFESSAEKKIQKKLGFLSDPQTLMIMKSGLQHFI